MIAGTGITLTPDAVNDKLTISGVNQYEHPETHPANMIVESSTKQFVSDSEKSTWNTVSNKVDKVIGKGLSTEDFTTTEKSKLENIDENANNYTHPVSHPPSIIAQNSNNRFTTDTEKSKWNTVDNKVDKVAGKQLSTEDFTTTEKSKLSSIATGATKNDTDTNLKNRANHTGTQTSSTISDFSSAVKSTVLSGLSTATNGLITTSDTILSALGKIQKQISDNLSILSTVATSGSYNDLINKPTIPTDTNQLTKTDVYTKTEVNGLLSSAGQGDMVKGVYDTNNNGIVDNAEKVNGFTVETNVLADAKFTDTIYTHPSTHPYSMITGVPTSLPANGGNSDTSKGLIGDDTRDINSPPSEYMNGGSRYIGRAGWQTEFKRAAIIGVSSYLSGTYCYLETKNPWSDPSGGYPVQIAYGNGTPCWRVGVSTTAWSSWKLLGDNLHIGSSPPSDNTTHWIDTSI